MPKPISNLINSKMKKQELRQLIREIIAAEVSIGPDGSLKGANDMFDDFDDLPKEFPAWYSGFQKGMNAIKSAPEGAQVQKHLKALRELGSETVDMLRFFKIFFYCIKYIWL